MSKKLAIQGHPTRGKEVIELLEMLGGENSLIISECNLSGYEPFNLYYINDNGVINYKHHSLNKDMVIFTLEEFLEKYPFKIGDVIRFPNDMVEEIAEMKWDEDLEDILCTSVSGWKRFLRAHLENPKNNKQKETMLVDNISSKWVNEFECPDGYIFKDENGNVINTTKIILEKIKKEYPKTYKECCDVLGYSGNYNMILTTDVDNKIFNALYRLKVCRDAYWKIAGDEIGLGKPWKPDFTNDDEERYGIYTAANKVVKDFCGVGDVNTILTFPTEEMRDEFYKNFKDFIEQCKELL